MLTISNDQIVWDSDKKKWVNTDGEAEESEQFRPPPKMADLAPRLGGNGPSFQTPNATTPMFGGAGPPQTAYDSPLPPSIPSPGPPGISSASLSVPTLDSSQLGGKTPSLQSNMFKKQRNQSK